MPHFRIKIISPELLLVLLVVGLYSCATGKLYYNDSKPIEETPSRLPDFTVYALGDGGEDNEQARAVMKQVATIAADDTQPGLAIFLGDNIYPAGMPSPEDGTARKEAEDDILNQVNVLTSFKGEIVFIPGNHDWNEFKKGGLEAIRRQGEFLDQLNKNIRLEPPHGCGGPVTLPISKDCIMIILDSQWWLQDWSKESKMNEGCKITSREEFIGSFKDIIDSNRQKQIIVSLHHPLFSQGAHGGHFTWKDHFFPLTKIVKWLYLPLPVIGSIYPYYRSVIGHPQDIRHSNYRAMKESILEAVDGKSNVVFLSGHDHNLQYLRRNGHHFIVSGSISKQNPIANSKNLLYGHMAPGFIQLDYYNNQGVFLTVYEVDEVSGRLETVFSRFIIDYSSP